jgi:hypothetical protein
VIHACEHAREVLPVLEGQLAVGMRPYIVTPQGEGTAELYLTGKKQELRRSLSLLRSWQDVRNWRKSLLECSPETSCDLVHAHCFAAGMAAVRNCTCVVYDLGACIEEMAMAASLCEPGSWMGRSFRVAEQFILSRAGAVVVHSPGMKQAALERGAAAENIFQIPEPMDGVLEPPTFEKHFLASRFGLSPKEITFFVPQFVGENTPLLSAEAATLLEAFSLAATQLPESRLLLEAPESARQAIHKRASHLGIAAHIFLVHPLDAPATLHNADAIIDMGTMPAEPIAARQASEVSLKSLCAGKALLAADVPRNRDANPDGIGCLWFAQNNPLDMSARMAFLGHAPEFRAALGAAGRKYMLETRSSTAVGLRYDQAYRHAFSRRKSGSQDQGLIFLQPEIGCG